MLRTEDNETEILLGNKQLLGVFFVVAILLGVAFYGGYMVGKAAPEKKAASQQQGAASAPSATSPTGGQTYKLPADNASTAPAPDPTDATNPPDEPPSPPPLGTPKSKKPQPPPQPEPSTGTEAAQTTPPAKTSSSFAPEPGQEFLQVAAVGRDQALAVADVLHAKGFHAHAVQKPGTTNLYRVLIGPVRDAADLSTTRDALRNIGFREVIVQKY